MFWAQEEFGKFKVSGLLGIFAHEKTQSDARG